MVVVEPPLFEHDLGFVHGGEQLSVEQLFSLFPSRVLGFLSWGTLSPFWRHSR